MLILNLRRFTRQTLIFFFDLLALLITTLVLSLVPATSVFGVVDDELKAVWTILLIFVPLIGALIYMIARPAEANLPA